MLTPLLATVLPYWRDTKPNVLLTVYCLLLSPSAFRLLPTAFCFRSWRELLGSCDHTAEHPPDSFVFSRQFVTRLSRQVTTINGEVKPDLGFGRLGIRVSKLACEHARILALAKPLRNVGCHTAGRSADLAGQRIPLFLRERFRSPKNVHCQLARQLVNLEVAVPPQHRPSGR